MAKRRQTDPTPEWVEASNHPIAWFSALLRGVDRTDVTLIDRATAELKDRGFDVRLVKPHPDRQRSEGGSR